MTLLPRKSAEKPQRMRYVGYNYGTDVHMFQFPCVSQFVCYLLFSVLIVLFEQRDTDVNSVLVSGISKPIT